MSVTDSLYRLLIVYTVGRVELAKPLCVNLVVFQYEKCSLVLSGRNVYSNGSTPNSLAP